MLQQKIYLHLVVSTGISLDITSCNYVVLANNPPTNNEILTMDFEVASYIVHDYSPKQR